MNQRLFIFAALCWNIITQSYQISFDQDLNNQKDTLAISIQLAPNEMILKQTMKISIDNPHIKIKQLHYPASEKKYIPAFSETKEIFENNAQFLAYLDIATKQNIDTHLYVSFLTLPDNIMHQEIHKLSYTSSDSQENSWSSSDYSSDPSVASQIPKYKEKKSFTQKLQEMLQTTDTLWIRLLFALLLGLLLSLTPCIYPMIPITIGVLQNNQNKSFFANLFGSLCYSFGLSTTFALLGLLAAFAGASFGSLLSNPIFVLFLVTFIGYMSLTMIGVIDLSLPSFLQRSATINSSFGPYLSVYLFGLISGSVASPCVSPGLALLLTIVATMGNIFSGFLLLFFFGIGLSVPLIVIGTFSSSMNMMPQAGQWMVEIKKALGFVMLATCLYYLSNITPAYIFNWLLVAYILFAALFYILDAQKDFDTQQKTIKSLLGILLLALAVVMSLRAYDRMSATNIVTDESGVTWAENYDTALATAQAEGKLLVLDFWANHCTICKAIDKKIFKKNIVGEALKNNFVFVKIDCTSSSNKEANDLKEKFKVYAQPAILVVKPEGEIVIKKWSSEPYSMTPELFIQTMLKIK